MSGAVSPLETRTTTSVVSAAALTDTDATPFSSGELAFTEDTKQLWILDKSSTAPLGPACIATRSGVGRWLVLFTIGGPGPLATQDYILVGLGTSGAALAKFLSDPTSPGVFPRSVGVLEAGINLSANGTPGSPFAGGSGVQAGSPFGDFAGNIDPARSEAFFTNVNTGPEGAPTFGHGYLTGLGVYQPQSTGRMWGGSSGHNFLQAVRGTPDIYDDWATTAADPTWNYDSLLHLMKSLETYTSNGSPIDLTQRGTTGPLFLTQDPANTIPPFGPPGNSAPLLAAMATATHAAQLDDYNDTPEATPANWCSTSLAQWFATPGADARSFSASAFMNSSVVDQATGLGVGGRRLTVLSGATVTTILITDTGSGPVARGVFYYLDTNPNEIFLAQANVKVILCAGGLADCAILQRSGVGPAALLASLDIPVVVDSPTVGTNLQCHVGTITAMPAGGFGTNPSLFQILYSYANLAGTVAHPTTYGDGTIPDNTRRAQIQLIYGFNALPPALLAGLPPLNPLTTIFGFNFNLREASRGTVNIVSKDPLTKPAINFNFLDPLQPTDTSDLADNLKVVANISIQFTNSMPIWPPAAHYPNTYPGGTQLNDNQLIQDAKSVYVITNHCVGTCPMGTAIANGVVDSQLNVFGVQNLSVCSNSIMPKITTGNTAYPAYVIGMKKAEIEGVVIP